MGTNIFPPVREAMQAMVTGFLDGNKADGEVINKALHQPFLNELAIAFCQMNNFETKLAEVDKVFENYPVFEPLHEFCFDLLMANFFASDSKNLNENYLESPEWLAIEDNTLDRGTEFLNILLYIHECKEAGADISLDDFLKEFLLTEDDLYQDEYMLYEPIIKNQHLVDADIEEVARIAQTIDEAEIQEIFLPLMVFFNTAQNFEDRYSQLLQHSHNKEADAALFMGITAFTNSLDTEVGE